MTAKARDAVPGSCEKRLAREIRGTDRETPTVAARPRHGRGSVTRRPDAGSYNGVEPAPGGTPAAMSTQLIEGVLKLIDEEYLEEAGALLSAVRRHPLLALLGVGVGGALVTLAARSADEDGRVRDAARRSSMEEWGEGFRDTVSAMQEDAVYFANETGETLAEVTERMMDSAEELEEAVAEASMLERARDADLRPLAAGVALFGIGIVTGMLVSGGDD